MTGRRREEESIEQDRAARGRGAAPAPRGRPSGPDAGKSRPSPGGRGTGAGSTLLRRLALAKLRELRQAGLSYREIAGRFAYAAGTGPATRPGGFRYRLPPERLLQHSPAEADAPFLRALDVLEQGLGFFDCAGHLLHENRALRACLEASCEGERLRAELQLFADALCRLAGLRGLREAEVVERLDVREVPLGETRYTLQGGFIGLDLFGQGSCVVVTLEPPRPDPLSAESLKARFGLTRQEARLARRLAEGRSNGEIARELFISPATARHHTQHILRKLGAHARAEVALRLLQPEAHEK